MKKFMDHFHTYAMFFWIIMFIPTVLWWKESVLWVAIMSLYANIASEAGAREAKKAQK